MKRENKLTAIVLILFTFSFQPKIQALDESIISIGSSIESKTIGKQLVARGIPRKLLKVLTDFRPRRFKVGPTELSLGKNSMRHILTRHHPDYWDGTSRQKQTFFKRNMSSDDISNAIETVITKRRQKIIEIGPKGTGKVRAEVNGTNYVLGIENGRIGTFYPEE